MPGVTITAGYGAGGSYVAPAVATALGYPLLDRAISTDIAAKLKVTLTEAEEGAPKRSRVDRFLSVLTPLAGGVLGAGTDSSPANPALAVEDQAKPFRDQAEAIMREALETGAVIHGRAGAAAFRNDPTVLHVRLYGPVEARIAQGARLQDVPLEAARKAQAEVDRARAHYVRRLYSVGIDDQALYEMQLDSTALPLDVCVEVIVAAYRCLLPRA
jgi:cytidylate kinase